MHSHWSAQLMYKIAFAGITTNLSWVNIYWGIQISLSRERYASSRRSRVPDAQPERMFNYTSVLLIAEALTLVLPLSNIVYNR